MPTLRHYTVAPRLPPQLERLRPIAYNIWWVWSQVARELFIRIDLDLWEAVHGNPVELLAKVPQERLDELALDDAFVSHLDAAWQTFQRYMSREGWFARSFPAATGTRIAYLSMEYGLHESLPIYSGGLGVLAGDHLKTASDLGLPLVGVGLAYAEGYFRQALNDDGWQGERYPLNDWHGLPVQPVVDGEGKRRIISVQYPNRRVAAQIWRVDVGRVPLFLLDANLAQNSPEDRSITGSLYGGDQEFRVRQEIMLGIGGMAALDALGLRPTICHMNEGHSAFLALERISQLMREKGVSFSVASEAGSAGNLFTTHTPVPAGNDAFAPDLIRRYLEPQRVALGLSDEQLLSLGRVNPHDSNAPFSMPVLALRTSDNYNAVSKLHGEVSREMWKGLWPELPAHEVPIAAITNGVHIPSWISGEIAALFTRYLGPHWADRTDDVELWERTLEIPDAELWQAHEHRRHRLVTLARRWVHQAAERRSAGPDELDSADEALDPRAFTIGFARRFATYKRAALLFSDPARVKKLLGNPDRPVQLIFAGKAHPQDRGGKELIRTIVHSSRELGIKGKVVFIEDYDMRIARAMVSGVDVWLNTPRRPLEASGTSGMKAAANGAINLSILDGWFAEAFHDHGRDIGWAIGHGEQYEDGSGDAVEAELLYDLLEREVVPLYFERETRDRLPRAWIRRMKLQMSKLIPRYNTMRMVREYTSRFYIPAASFSHQMMDNDLAGAKSLAAWKARIENEWPNVAIFDLTQTSPSELLVGDHVMVNADVRLGGLSPDDVTVELYYGATSGGHELTAGKLIPMDLKEVKEGGVYRFVGSIPATESGAHAFAARVMPKNLSMSHPYESALIRWA